MTLQEHLQTIAMEECNEIAHRFSKSLRFGESQVQPGQALTNRQRILYEVIDLGVVLDMLGFNLDNFGALVREDPFKKRAKIEKYLGLSRDYGTLTEKE